MHGLYITLCFTYLLGLPCWLVAEEPHGRKGPEWTLRREAYGSIRLVPEPEVPHRAIPQGWSGVESPYQRYAITLSFNAGRQMQPEQFEFVSPNIGIRGWNGASNSGLSFGVELFQRASTARDIRIDYREPPEVIEEDQEYLAAEVSGEKAITRWKVYIRFQREQPANAKAPSTP